MRNSILLIALFLAGLQINAQDTLILMHYNLLNYGVSTSYCTPTNNEISAKEAACRTIFDHAAPDILTVNEINPNAVYHKRFTDSTLNVLYPDAYAYKAGTNVSGDIHSNGIFYRVSKLALSRHFSIPTATRDFDLYTLYYLDPQLSLTQDTAFITLAVCHLKAGTTGADATERNTMALLLMGHLDTANISGPVLFSGDMNLKNSGEAAWATLTNFSNPAVRFQDPIASPGTWNNNASFAGIHTQSTQTTTSGCASGGGMDDRFDIIFANASAMTGADHYQVISSSYKALGNDGQHFNSFISSGVNTAVPQAVAEALHFASDHLPVVVKLKVDQGGAGFGDAGEKPWIDKVRMINGEVVFHADARSSFIAELTTADGRVLGRSVFPAGSGECRLRGPGVRGIYLLRVVEDNGRVQVRKLSGF